MAPHKANNVPMILSSVVYTLVSTKSLLLASSTWATWLAVYDQGLLIIITPMKEAIMEMTSYIDNDSLRNINAPIADQIGIVKTMQLAVDTGK